MANNSILKQKGEDFAVRIVNCCKYLQNTKNENTLSKQILRSGTSIGANVREAEHAESKIDFIHKMKIALKEANETAYWLELLHETNYLDETQFQVLNSMCVELNRVLISIVKTTKDNISNNS